MQRLVDRTHSQRTSGRHHNFIHYFMYKKSATKKIINKWNFTYSKCVVYKTKQVC